MTIAEQVFERLKRAPETVAREVLAYLKKLEASRHPPVSEAKLADLIGSLKNSPSCNGDPTAMQRKLRDEWS